MIAGLLFALLGRSAAEPGPVVTLWDLTPLKSGAEASAESRRRCWDLLHAASALEGLANRNGPKLYIDFVGRNGTTDRYWWRRLRTTWLKGSRVSEITSLDEAIQRFRNVICGVVVWDERVPATSNIASTVAGVENLLPVRYDPARGSLYSRLVLDPAGPRLPVKERLLDVDGGPLFTGSGMISGTSLKSSGSAKDDAYLWAAAKFLRKGQCVGGFMGYYPDAFWLSRPKGVPLERTLLTNHDFFMAKKAFIFDLDPWEDETPDDDPNQRPGSDSATLKQILSAEYRLGGAGFTQVGGFTPWDQKYTDYTGRKHGGVPTEWRYAEILSCFNAFMDADAPGLNAMANASMFMHEPLKARYPQPNLPVKPSLTAKGYLMPDGSVAKKAFVAMYVGDYDSAAWLYQMMPKVWDDPARGTIPLGWAFNPDLEARFPTGLVYARDTATPNDTFVSGDSGAGYLNPGFLDPLRKWSGLPSGLSAWEALSRRLFRRWDLGIVGFVIDGYAPPMDEATKLAYSRFAPCGVVAQKVPAFSIVNGTPFLRMGSDLPHDVSAAADLVARLTPRDGPSFSIYRTVLWTPSEHAALFKRVRLLRPDVEFVEPYTLTTLAKAASRQREMH